MELGNEWFPTRKFRKVDTPFRIDCTHEKEIMAALSLTGNALHKPEIEHNGKYGHNLVRIQHIALMSRIGICYTAFRLATKAVAPTIPSFQGIKCCIQYLASHPHKPIFYPSYSYDGSNIIRLTWSGNHMEYYTTQNFYIYIKMRIIL